MATSGVYTFDPPVGSLAAYALGRVGVRRSAIEQEHLSDAYMAANLILQGWSAQQPKLWTLDTLTFALTQGQQVVTLPENFIIVTDAYIQTQVSAGVVNNRIIFPVGRSEWISYPNPFTQAFPTIYWFNRVLPPTVNLYPVPDGNGPYTLYVFGFRQNQDSLLKGQIQAELPGRWLLAYADAIAAELAPTYAPDKYLMLAEKAAGSYKTVSDFEREVVPIYIAPGLSSYFDR